MTGGPGLSFMCACRDWKQAGPEEAPCSDVVRIERIAGGLRLAVDYVEYPTEPVEGASVTAHHREVIISDRDLMAKMVATFGVLATELAVQALQAHMEAKQKR